MKRFGFVVLLLPFISTGCMGASGEAGGRFQQQPSREWNQQSVTALSEQLMQALGTSYETVRKSPQLVTGLQQNAMVSTLDDSRRLREEARRLHAQLARGQDRDETLGSYRVIKEVSRAAEKSGAWISRAAGVAASENSVENLFLRLDQYYGVQ